MTLLDALVFFFCVVSVACAIDTFSLSANRWAPGLVAAALAALGLNRALSDRPVEAVIMLAAVVVAASLPWRIVRWLTLVVLAAAGPLVVRPRLVHDLWVHVLVPDRVRIALTVAGLAIAVLAGSVVVDGLIRLVGGVDLPADEGAREGGRTIGMLERALVFGAVLAGHPEAAGLVVAVKSLARVPEFRRNSLVSIEYFLIGTLASLLVALAAGYAVRSGLHAVS